MNWFDSEIVGFVNQFSQHSWIFDQLIVSLSGNSLLKGGVLVMIMWWEWFDSNEPYTSYDRSYIIVATLLSCFVALVFARALAMVLPFRPRPMHEAALAFLIPFGMAPTDLEGWSSFPSDHAVLFFALSTGLLFLSRKAGVVALAYTAALIAFPRLYVGFHYPTDIIAGAIIGITVALFGNIYLIKSAVLQSITIKLRTRPRVFYTLLFLLTYQIADTFNSSRDIGSAGARLFRYIFG